MHQDNKHQDEEINMNQDEVEESVTESIWLVMEASEVEKLVEYGEVALTVDDLTDGSSLKDKTVYLAFSQDAWKQYKKREDKLLELTNYLESLGAENIYAVQFNDAESITDYISSQEEEDRTPEEVLEELVENAIELEDFLNKKIILDDEMKNSLPPLTEEEYRQLEQSILDNGCQDSLIVWEEENILIDGYHRHKICQEHEIPFTVVRRTFATKMDAKVSRITNQLACRNLTPLQRDYQIGRLYNEIKQCRGGDRKSNGQNGRSGITSEQIAKIVKRSEKTVRRNGSFADAIDTIAEITGNDFTDNILRGEIVFTREDVPKIVNLESKEIEELVSRIKEKKTKPSELLKQISSKKEAKTGSQASGKTNIKENLNVIIEFSEKLKQYQDSEEMSLYKNADLGKYLSGIKKKISELEKLIKANRKEDK